jgi:hypothetical protein
MLNTPQLWRMICPAQFNFDVNFCSKQHKKVAMFCGMPNQPLPETKQLPKQL